MNIAANYHRKSVLTLMLLGTLLNLVLTTGARGNTEACNSRNLVTLANDDVVLGNKDAAVTVIEYFAPTCTHCNDFHQGVFQELKAKYIDTGKIAYVMREFVGNKQDLDASILARCPSENESYLKLMEVILSTQEEWAFNKNYRQKLSDIGVKGGVSEERYTKCLADDALTETFIQNAKLAANAPDFIGTPSFFINGKQISPTFSKEQFFNEIEQTLKGLKEFAMTLNQAGISQ